MSVPLYTRAPLHHGEHARGALAMHGHGVDLIRFAHPSGTSRSLLSISTSFRFPVADAPALDAGKHGLACRAVLQPFFFDPTKSFTGRPYA